MNLEITTDHLFEILNLSHWNLPFDWAQGGEFVEPFEIWFLVLGISMIFIKQKTFAISVDFLFN
jgi:hypothetical protein